MVGLVWSGRAQPAEFWVPADAGLALPWTAVGTVDVLDDWLRHTGGSIGMDRRIFLAVSGATLTAPAWGYVDHLGAGRGLLAALADKRRGITVTSAMVDDASQHGLSQRYFISGLRAAHTAGDRSVGTYLLADMSQTRVNQGRLDDGVDLGRAARDAVELTNAACEAARSTPAVVRVLAASAFAKAQAVVGNAHGFHVAAEEARVPAWNGGGEFPGGESHGT
jgi:hypothetical protein